MIGDGSIIPPGVNYYYPLFLDALIHISDCVKMPTLNDFHGSVGSTMQRSNRLRSYTDRVSEKAAKLMFKGETGLDINLIQLD